MVERFRGMLNGIMSKNSLYNTLPINAKLFNQIINEYVNLRNEKRVRNVSDEEEESNGSRKKRSCGKYNGNYTFNVIVKK